LGPREPVERPTGRTVKAFISGIDTAVDGVAVGTFVLHIATGCRGST
jgi:hypothetical protein